MTENSEQIVDSVSRRSVLRKGAATGALFVVGSAASGSASAHQGGVALFHGTARANQVFTIRDNPPVGERIEDLEPTCLENKAYRAYQAEYWDDTNEYTSLGTGLLWVDPYKDITFDNDPTNPGALHEWRNVRSCTDESENAPNLTNRGNMAHVNPGQGNGPPG